MYDQNPMNLKEVARFAEQAVVDLQDMELLPRDPELLRKFFPDLVQHKEEHYKKDGR